MDQSFILNCFDNTLAFVQGFFVFRILSLFADKQFGRIWDIIIYFSCTTCTCMVIFPNDFFNITLDLIWLAVMMLLAFKGSIWQRLAAVAVLYPLMVSQNFFILDILGVTGTWLGWSTAIDIFCSLADPILHLLIWLGIYKIFKKYLSQMKRLFNDKIWMLLDIICLASLVNITTCIYFTPKDTYKMWPAAFACFATNLGCVALAKYFVISIQQNLERKNLKLQKSYYKELEQNQAEIRKIRHDMNNHLSVIHSLFYSGSKEEAEHYMKDMEAQLTAQSRFFCKNSIVNAVLNSKYNLALEQGIDCFFHIDLDKLIGIDAISLCCLFANTLDNALEASEKIENPEERRISVKARVTESGYFTYEIANSKNKQITKQQGQLKSEKEDTSSHGLGLSNVREMVEKYNGTLDISYTEDTFTVTVLIQNA